MKLAAVVHMYPPRHNAGAEWMLHAILRYLVDAGHEAHVVISNGLPADSWTFEGIDVVNTGHPGLLAEHVAGDDILLTHLDRTRDAMSIRRRSGQALVHLVHNDKQLRASRVIGPDAQLVVFNSHWLYAGVRWGGPKMVVHPPVEGDRYRTTPGDGFTLVNLREAKGYRTFVAVARMMPDRTFLGVQGAYGRQMGREARPRNVELVKPTVEMARDVYSRTRVLLMPSDYESFGRVAIEAGHSGIPTIAHPTPGLVEALGPTGIFVDRKDIAVYADSLLALDDEDVYEAASADALATALRWESTSADELAELETKLKEL